MSSDGSIVKADKDFTKEVDAALPEAEKIAQVCSDGDPSRLSSTEGNRMAKHSKPSTSCSP